MEGIGSEVSQKIRAAIKAKLIELGAYVDDELPDYIMVMVANKRTKSQMDEDLQLFLTSNTKIFTSWLHTVLQKLQEVTIANFAEGKTDNNDKKPSKRKKQDSDNEGKSRKSSDDGTGKMKKHSKKHKEAKKAKKNKHKSKEKVKIKSEKKEKEDGGNKSGKATDNNVTKTPSQEEDLSSKSKPLQINEAVGKAILGNIKKSKDTQSNANNSCSDTSSHSEECSNAMKKLENQNAHITDADKVHLNGKTSGTKKSYEAQGNGGTTAEQSDSKTILIEDEFNIEPLKPTEKRDSKELNETQEATEGKDIDCHEVQHEKTISVPTEKLLEEHNKLLKEKSTDGKKQNSDSEDSMSPEEMRKQLLLSRAKKKLENSKLAERMKSNSPDVLILDETSRTASKDFGQSSSKPGGDLRGFKSSPPRSDVRNQSSSRPSPKRRFSESSGSSAYGRSRSPVRSVENQSRKSRPKEEASKSKISTDKREESRGRTKDSLGHFDRETDRRQLSNERGKKENTSGRLEYPEDAEAKKGTEKTRERENTSSRKRTISSRVVTITGPEAPEISSVVKVKPREYIAKDKQANKALILKAVADAEKSIATLPVRTQPEPQPKKDALFTKNLRGKRFEKLAVTLSNIRKSPDSRERLNRRVSVDSDKSERSRAKLDSSEILEGLRGKSDLLSRKIPKNDDQFISSKTTIMEKNDKYIRYWLEGVEKAVKDEGMVNPDEMEELIIHSNFSIQGSDLLDDDLVKKENEKKRKRLMENEAAAKNQKLTNARTIPNSNEEEDDEEDNDGPQIVVTLDGLDSKTVKDIIQRNKDSINGPAVSSRMEKETKEKVGKISQRLSIGAREKSDSRKQGFEKISDRFGRLNRASEDVEMEKTWIETKNTKQKDNVETNSTNSKNRQLIAQLSEKFGKVDRKFENKKRRYPEEERRYLYDSRKNERDDSDRNGRYKKSERKSNREGSSPSPPPSKFPPSSSSQICKFSVNCKNLDCRYYHPKKCRFDENCTNPECKYIHSESSTKSKKSKWYAKS
ncbi:hypothetical protein RUM44_004605 [Polyplax serrata]|uniref:Zinc finger CCCH domain-containing protein 14 n=1 Tax=Polyplax serrata TaxID=468196 RepID=A0ABR1B3C0_POLSC